MAPEGAQAAKSDKKSADNTYVASTDNLATQAICADRLQGPCVNSGAEIAVTGEFKAFASAPECGKPVN